MKVEKAEEDEDDNVHIESQISKELSDKITKIVVILVLIMLFMLPLLDSDTYVEH